jgi:hypothetical protein
MSKAIKLAPFQKLLTVMISGKPVTLDEMDTLLGKEIYMYRISTYMWHIKTNANGVVKAIKDGRKVTGYQLMNVKEVKEYMNRAGITNSGFKAGAVEKKPSISKLADLKATPVAKKTAVKQTEVETAGKQTEVVSDELTVTEITETA